MLMKCGRNLRQMITIRDFCHPKKRVASSDEVFMRNFRGTVECLRKRNSQIRFRKKFVGPKNIVGFHKINVTNSTIFSNFVERFHKSSPPTFFFDWSSILWKIDSAFASPFPLPIPQIKSGLFLWNLDL